MDDVHRRNRALKNGLSGLAMDKRIPESEKALILEYIKALESRGLYAGRIVKYLYILRHIRLMLGVNFKEATRENIEELVRKINAENFSPWTKADYKGIVKRFYRWLRTGALDAGAPYPPEVAWIKTNIKRNEKKEPVLTTKIRRLGGSLATTVPYALVKYFQLKPPKGITWERWNDVSPALIFVPEITSYCNDEYCCIRQLFSLGNSILTTIPAKMARALGFKVGDTLVWRLKNPYGAEVRKA